VDVTVNNRVILHEHIIKPFSKHRKPARAGLIPPIGFERVNRYDGRVQKKLKSATIVKVALLGLLVAVFVYLQVRWDLASFFSQERITSWLVMTGPFAPLVYMLIMAVAVVVSPIPSLPLDILAGAFFGPWLGTLYSALGALAGAIISFLIGRYLGREIVERFLGGHILFCVQCSDKLFTKVIFLSRLVPVISFDIVSYGAGLTKISVKRFALATFLGMLPLDIRSHFSPSTPLDREA
jgi:uncharacterized membrane protein YdjX (TVP38/TMEM64 family)